MRSVLLLTMIVTMFACHSSEDRLHEVIEKYSNPPSEGSWELVGDTHEFWNDITLLHQKSAAGYPDAIRTLLVIRSFTDGAVSEGMPVISRIRDYNPVLFKQVIMSDERLKGHCSHWVQ